MHVFTSVTANYIPKARVLAASVKKYHPEAMFHLVLSDATPQWLGAAEPFDSVIKADELGIPNFQSWAFKHSVVELCTAVKGFSFREIIRRYNADKVIYLDPDIVVVSPLDSITDRLDQFSVLLTPHLTVPETTHEAILDNEICSLKHGVFNLGFAAVRSTSEGLRFVNWWADRLHHYCYDDIPAGLFTDQRWIDLAPCFFEDLHILREPIYNVSTWNLSSRLITGSLTDGLLVNGLPLCFYHFSGFDSGAQQLMLNKYGEASPALLEFRQWYIEACDAAGQEQHGQTPCSYGFFDNGEPVTREQRLLYRSRPDLMQAFPDPLATGIPGTSYLDWYRGNAPRVPENCLCGVEVSPWVYALAVRLLRFLSPK